MARVTNKMKEKTKVCNGRKVLLLIINICLSMAILTACGTQSETLDETTEPSSSFEQLQDDQMSEEATLTEDKMKEIVDALLVELMKMDDGDSISTSQLMIRAGYDPDAYYPLDIVDVHGQFVEAAKDNGIILDMSKYEGMAVGLPQNLEFIIRK